MIRFDQQTIDVQGTEWVFKKVVHPGQKTKNFVDRNGVPVQMPTAANIIRNGTYVLSPRGVPTRKSTHCYSGQLIGPAKVNDWITSTDIPEIRSYSSTNSYGLSSAASLRHHTRVMLSSKKQAFGSGQQRSTKPSKSASNERFSSGTPSEKHNRESERWNPNLQSSRLEKEWSAVSQSRALKRSSEARSRPQKSIPDTIVGHRVDRMYFMTGNKIPIHNRYHVADEEVNRLKELSQARTSSKQLREKMEFSEEAKLLLEKYKKMDEQLVEKAGEEDEFILKEHEEIDESDRLVRIEQKLSNIEHQISHSEEAECENLNKKYSKYKDLLTMERAELSLEKGIEQAMSRESESSESGIMEDDIRIEDISDAEDKDNMDLSMGKENVIQSTSKESFAQDVINLNVVQSTSKENFVQGTTNEPNVLDVEFQSILQHMPVSKITFWDILKHNASTNAVETLICLLRKNSSNISQVPLQNMMWKSRKGHPDSMRLGVPRGQRQPCCLGISIGKKLKTKLLQDVTYQQLHQELKKLINFTKVDPPPPSPYVDTVKVKPVPLQSPIHIPYTEHRIGKDQNILKLNAPSKKRANMIDQPWKNMQPSVSSKKRAVKLLYQHQKVEYDCKHDSKLNTGNLD